MPLEFFWVFLYTSLEESSPGAVLMVYALSELRWGVPRHGFHWQETSEEIRVDDSIAGHIQGDEPELRWILKEKRPKYSKHFSNVYITGDQNLYYLPYTSGQPLYRIFAATEPTRAGILEFANKYGLLSARVALPPEEFEEDFGRREDPLSSTHLFWRRRIIEMDKLINLFDLYSKGDEDLLSELIRWSNKRDKVSYLPPPADRRDEGGSGAGFEALIAWKREASDDHDVRHELFEKFTPGDPFLPALTYVQRRVNRRIRHRTPPQLLWDGDGRLGLHHIPETLEQMLWLQFAESIQGGFTYKACPTCGRWVRVGQDAARKSRLYCSNACRTRAHRERQEQARRLHREGRTVPEIAEELGCEPGAVVKWVNPPEEGEH